MDPWCCAAAADPGDDDEALDVMQEVFVRV
jgi:hypothetical protein